MTGGKGNDIYNIDAPDQVTEKVGEGIDTIVSNISYVLGANFESLSLESGDISGTGCARQPDPRQQWQQRDRRRRRQ